MNVTERVAANVRRLRMERLGSVEQSCAASVNLLEEEISIPRWYRLEQGTHPGMLGDILDDVSTLLQVDPSVLVMDPEKSVAAAKRQRTVRSKRFLKKPARKRKKRTANA